MSSTCTSTVIECGNGYWDTSSCVCVCDTLYIGTRCELTTTQPVYPLHITFIVITTLISIFAIWRTINVALGVRQLLNAIKGSTTGNGGDIDGPIVKPIAVTSGIDNGSSTQLWACLFNALGSLAALSVSVTYLVAPFQTYRSDVIVALMLLATLTLATAHFTLRRILMAALKIHAPTRSFMRTMDRLALIFIPAEFICFLLAASPILMPTIIFNAFAACYSIMLVIALYRASRLLQSLLPSTRSVSSRQLLQRNVFLLRAAMVEALVLLLDVGLFSVGETPVTWNIFLAVELFLIMVLTVQVAILMGRRTEKPSTTVHVPLPSPNNNNKYVNGTTGLLVTPRGVVGGGGAPPSPQPTVQATSSLQPPAISLPLIHPTGQPQSQAAPQQSHQLSQIPTAWTVSIAAAPIAFSTPSSATTHTTVPLIAS
jgi:hypothetical protein